jgi:FtsP/CotA-like multicopper oxidase with cupredoxin domain
MRWFGPLSAAAVLAAAGVTMAVSSSPARPAPPLAPPTPCTAGDTLVDPPTIARGSNGILKTQLTMAPAAVTVGSITAQGNLYNGLYTPPTLLLNPGDSVDMNVTNQMVDSTNHHYHGFVVTPDTLHGDNVTRVKIRQGSTHRYAFRLPADHAQGLAWYHPHYHGLTDAQVGSGLSGAMVVGNLAAQFPGLNIKRERVMLIKDLNTKGTYSINGNPCPTIKIAAGEQQLWRLLNATAEDFLNLRLANHKLHVLALDGNPVVHPLTVDSLIIPPGSRAEVVVVGNAQDAVGSHLYSTNASADPDFASVSLGWAKAGGTPVIPTPIPTTVNTALRDSMKALMNTTDVQRQTINYWTDGGDEYWFGPDSVFANNQYSPSRIDYRMQVGKAQEWTLVNKGSELHSFHIHQTDFIVTSYNGKAPTDTTFRDNVFVGRHYANGKWLPDTVTVRFRFTPVAAGPFVFHCHQLFHEDAGMMRNVCVYPQGKDSTWCNQWFPATGGAMHHAARPAERRGQPGGVATSALVAAHRH